MPFVMYILYDRELPQYTKCNLLSLSHSVDILMVLVTAIQLVTIKACKIRCCIWTPNRFLNPTF